MQQVLDPDDVTLLTTIAENPDMSEEQFARCLAALTPEGRRIAKSIRALSTTNASRLTTLADHAAHALLEWVKKNRLEKKVAVA